MLVTRINHELISHVILLFRSVGTQYRQHPMQLFWIVRISFTLDTLSENSQQGPQLITYLMKDKFVKVNV